MFAARHPSPLQTLVLYLRQITSPAPPAHAVPKWPACSSTPTPPDCSDTASDRPRNRSNDTRHGAALRIDLSVDQPVRFERTQGDGQHPLRNIPERTLNVVETHRPFEYNVVSTSSDHLSPRRLKISRIGQIPSCKKVFIILRFYLVVVQHRLPFCNSLTKKSPLAEPDYLFYVCTTKVTNISLITIKNSKIMAKK